MKPFSLTLLGALICNASAPAAESTLDAIRERSLKSEWAYERLADLTDKIGPRLIGTPQAQAAIEQVAAAPKAEGRKVTRQPISRLQTADVPAN